MTEIVSPTPGTHFTNGLSTASQFNISNSVDPVAYNTRWQWNLAGAESTANAGSNLQLQAIADDGKTILSTPISVNRATGVVSILTESALTTTQVTASINLTTASPATTRDIYGTVNANYAGAITVGGGSGSLVGTRGLVHIGNAAGVLGAGYYYGAQGKVDSVAGGTIGSGAHAFGVVGQFDMSAGVISGDPQISAIWGDMGATSPASGWGANSSILSGQNTTAAAVNSHVYTYGKAAYWQVIASNGGAFVADATGALTPSGNAVKLKVNVNGADYWVLAAATYS